MKKNFLIVTLIIFGLFILPLKNNAEDEIGQELKLYKGEAKILSVSSPTRIVIGNPNVLDVTQVTKSEVTLAPKEPGTTTLVIWDNLGEQSYKAMVVAEHMDEIKERVDNLLAKLNLPEVYTQAEEAEGKVILLGRVKSSDDKERIKVALGQLQEKTLDLIQIKEEEAVIEIDVQILELNKDATNTLGFTWPGSITLTDSSGSTTTAVTGLKRVFHVSDFTRSAFNITLDALVQEGKAKILSRPRLACQSGKEAELLVGGEKPIITTQVITGGSSGTQVDYKEYGIKLRIRPTVMEERRIKLVLNVEVSEVGEAEVIGSATAPTAKAYPLSKRTASTELFLDNEQTLAIGGLIKEKSEEDIRKTAGLGDLPILGLFFRKKQTKTGGGQGQRGDTELFITLTPTIVSGFREAGLQKETEKRDLKISSSGIGESVPVFLSGYASAIQKRILENLTYPTSAKEAGFQGTVKLSLLLSYHGELLDAAIKESSGYNVLDENALSVARKSSPYPPFPPSVESKELWIDIPINYQLN